MRSTTTALVILFSISTLASTAPSPSPVLPPPSLEWSPASPPTPDYHGEFKHHLVERSVSSSSGTVIYPPAAWFSIYNLTGLADIAAVMVNRMQTWYQPDTIPNYEWTQGWQVPLLGMALADLDLTFGNSANQALIRNMLNLNSANNYQYDQYVDDQSWWGMFALRGYQAYGNITWLQSIQNLAGINQQAADQSCGGGLRWVTYDYTQKNTITNMLQFSILTRLYRVTGYQQYYTDSVALLSWWLGWAFDPSTGKVWDTLEMDGCTPIALQGATYNSGVVLFGLADLYYATGNESLLDIGRSIAYAAMASYTIPGIGILQESCEHNTDTSNGPPGCLPDEISFKGSLVLGLAEFYLARPDPNIYAFVNTQLLSVLWHDLDETWLAGEWWAGPWNETTAGPKTQLTAICLVAAASIINANFLAAAGRNVTGGTTGQLISTTNSTTIIAPGAPVVVSLPAQSFATMLTREVGIVVAVVTVGFASLWI